MNRKEAIAAGHRTYDADKPCKYHHFPTKRYIGGGACATCMRQRYQHSVHPESRTVRVPKELLPAFDAMCIALGITQPAVSPDALTYDGEFPGVPAAPSGPGDLDAARAEAAASPEQQAYNERDAKLSRSLFGRSLYEAMAPERAARDAMRERVAAKHGVTAEQLA